MDAKKFINEMSDVVRKFEECAREEGVIIEATEVEICNGYMSLFCTIEDKHGDAYGCSQEVEIFNEELNPLFFVVNYC